MLDFAVFFRSFARELSSEVPRFRVEAWQSIQHFGMLVKAHLSFTRHFKHNFSTISDCNYQENTETD